MKIRFKSIHCTLLLLLAISITACNPGSGDPHAKIDEMERSYESLTEQNASQAQLIAEARPLIEQYLTTVQNQPKHKQAPNYLYQAAMLRASNLQNYYGAIQLLEQLRRNYPEHERAEKALFMIGYTYAEQLNENEAARVAYKKFLTKYPDSELAESVRFELNYLGKDEEEIEFIRELSKKAGAE